MPGKMHLLEVDLGSGDGELPTNAVKAGSKTKLAKEIQDIIKMIFDVDNMKQAMKEFEIDMEKMPLGKLSKNQIRTAYGVLTELQDMMADGGSPAPEDLLRGTNQFYTLIPHDFGHKAPQMLNSLAVIKKKCEMLDSLLEIELAYNILKSDTAEDSERDPIDVHYEKLHTDMKVLDKQSDEFKLIDKYVKNTHAATHGIKLGLKDVIKIDREGECDRFGEFKKLHNRMLLWHGSRLSNFAGILSQGLRIAPPEAPATGYMFGKGVYFADMVTKSANYCFAQKEGLMLLCEVALGNMMEEKNAKNIVKPVKGKHSCKGLGATFPDPKDTHVTEDGVCIPVGKPVNASVGSSLLYNEYIVYDVAQIRMKYLLRMDFKSAMF